MEAVMGRRMGADMLRLGRMSLSCPSSVEMHADVAYPHTQVHLLHSLTGSCKPHYFIFPFSDLPYCCPTHPAAVISTGIPRYSSAPCPGATDGDKVAVLSSVKNFSRHNCISSLTASAAEEKY